MAAWQGSHWTRYSRSHRGMPNVMFTSTPAMQHASSIYLRILSFDPIRHNLNFQMYILIIVIFLDSVVLIYNILKCFRKITTLCVYKTQTTIRK